MAYSNDKPIDDLADVVRKFPQLQVTDHNYYNNNSHESSHAQSLYSSHPRNTQPRLGLSVEAEKRKNIALNARTPQGSKLLQTVLLESNKDEFKKLIFEAVYEYMFDFMTHQSATIVFVTLLNFCNDHQLSLIVENLKTMNTDMFVTLLCDKSGSSSMKKLIKVLKDSPLVSDITSLLVRDFGTLMRNRVSSSVIIKCFECLDVEQNKELFEATIRDCLELATDEKGCFALIQSMGFFMKQPYRNLFLGKISSQARFLSQDPSGNYVVQQVMELCNPRFNREICNLLKGSFVKLSMEKCSSHVVEKCLLSDEGMDLVLEEFIKCDHLWKVARNQNGNYVIQKALDMAKGSAYYEAFLAKLCTDKHMSGNGHGKHVYNKLIDIITSLSQINYN